MTPATSAVISAAAPTHRPPVLEVRDLRIEFATRRGPLCAVDGVSLTILPGEILGVVGESGAGKSLTGTALEYTHALPQLLDIQPGIARGCKQFRFGGIADELHAFIDLGDLGIIGQHTGFQRSRPVVVVATSTSVRSRPSAKTALTRMRFSVRVPVLSVATTDTLLTVSAARSSGNR